MNHVSFQEGDACQKNLVTSEGDKTFFLLLKKRKHLKTVAVITEHTQKTLQNVK